MFRFVCQAHLSPGGKGYSLLKPYVISDLDEAAANIPLKLGAEEMAQGQE